MSLAFKCDQCKTFFDGSGGLGRWKGEVCDMKGGWVKWRVTASITTADGIEANFCPACIGLILKAAVAGEKL